VRNDAVTPNGGTTVVPGAHGAAFRAEAGDEIAVVDLEGGQAVDMFAFCADDLSEHLSASHTRVALIRAFPAVGQAFFTDRRQPILTVIADTSPGHHDMLLAACDAARYELLGAPGHRSCADNLFEAFDALGLAFPLDTVPQPVNLFTYIPIHDDGSLEFMPGDSRAGDRIVFRAERDVVFVVSACPQDLTPINHGRSTSIAVEVAGRA